MIALLSYSEYFISSLLYCILFSISGSRHVLASCIWINSSVSMHVHIFLHMCMLSSTSLSRMGACWLCHATSSLAHPINWTIWIFPSDQCSVFTFCASDPHESSLLRAHLGNYKIKSLFRVLELIYILECLINRELNLSKKGKINCQLEL